jgi:hypothetical protein
MSSHILSNGRLILAQNGRVIKYSTHNQPSERPFITTWDTTKGSWGDPDDPTDASVYLYLNNGEYWDSPAYNYAFTVKWGDGTEEFISGLDDPRIEPANYGAVMLRHEYNEPGIYDIEISGIFGGLYMSWEDYTGKLIDIKQWGDIIWDDAEVAFAGCTNLHDWSATDTPNLSQISNAQYMFSNCEILQNPNMSGWNTSSLVIAEGLFDSCPSLENPNLSGWDFSSVTTIDSFFSRCYSLTNPDLSDWDLSSLEYAYGFFGTEWSPLENLHSPKMKNWKLGGNSSILDIFKKNRFVDPDLSGWDLAGITSLYRLFDGCVNLRSPNMSNWNVPDVSTVQQMFHWNTEQVENPNLSGWNTSSLLNMQEMFAMYNNKLTPAAIQTMAGWDVSKVTNMSMLFPMTLIDDETVAILGQSWDTSNVVNMGMLMWESLNLISPDFTGWDVSSVEQMWAIFDGCANFESPDFSGWDVSNLQRANHMFDNIHKEINPIGIDNWTPINLVGGGGNAGFRDAFRYASIPTDLYDNLLVKWSSLTFTNTYIQLHIGSSQYSSQAQAFRDILTGEPNNWALTDGGVAI